jgi:uncharacterized protein (TIGR02265 family)
MGLSESGRVRRRWRFPLPKTTVTLADPLVGSIDLDAIIREVPPGFQAKGMFFARLANQLGDGFEALLPKLAAPPKLGRYVPFSDYPQGDYMRISAAVAQKLYPSVGLREGFRRLSRDDFGVFASSTLGKIFLAAIGDARSALLKVPAIYQKMAPGSWTVHGEELDASTIRLEFGPHPGAWEFQLGQLEGVVLNFGGTPVTTITTFLDRKIQFDVRYVR